ncbi:cytochrome b [Beijerinckia sp. L45]|uniref:cytochrome b n=1 Tax=Beijerinckia sp. L45 TaxID=1641855 RepID=UPI00131C5ADA|nr:cytochrome b [Beijerinckia sp. L45]
MKDITARVAPYFTAGTRRYTPAARAFHWISALLIFTVVPLGWIFAEFKKPPGGPDLYASLHKTLGLVILAVILARLAYRAMNPPPAQPGRMAAWERVSAAISHWLLYFIFLAMPISGYVMSSGSKRPISILGLFDFPKLPMTTDIAETAKQIHILGQWAVYAVVLIHVAATVWHLAVRRDAILDRMLPRQVNAE